jgi:hypothetical protein
MMTSEKRDARFNMMMTVSEREMLRAIAIKVGLTESDVLRQHVRKAYAETFGDKPPKKPKR